MAIPSSSAPAMLSGADALRKQIFCELCAEYQVPDYHAPKIYQFLKSQAPERLRKIAAGGSGKNPISLNEFRALREDMKKQGVQVAVLPLAYIVVGLGLLVVIGSSTGMGTALWKKRIKPQIDEALKNKDQIMRNLGVSTSESGEPKR